MTVIIIIFVLLTILHLPGRRLKNADDKTIEGEKFYWEYRQVRYTIQTSRDYDVLTLVVKKQIYALMKKHRRIDRDLFISQFGNLWVFYHNKRAELLFQKAKK